jgi:hypothetical protein
MRRSDFVKKFIRLTISELEEIIEKANKNKEYNSGAGCIDININGEMFEIEQPCVYQECNSAWYKTGQLKDY